MSEPMFKISGLETIAAGLGTLESKYKEAAELSFESVVREMANHARNDHTGFHDITSNLRNSINVTSDESKVPTIPSSTSRLQSLPRKPDVEVAWEGDTLKGVLYAGMEYATSVEFRPGKHVIGGAFKYYKSRWFKLVVDRMKGYLS